MRGRVVLEDVGLALAQLLPRFRFREEYVLLHKMRISRG